MASIEIPLKGRPVSKERLQAVVTDLTTRIKNDFPLEIQTQQIGEMVLGELFKLDEVAYVRYASTHKLFGDKDEFITTLKALPGSLQVVKSNGRYEPFKRDKLTASMTIALRKRPVSRRKIEKIAEEIIESFAQRDEISSSEIGNLVMKRLREIDEVAYIRYASVYRKFRDASEFAREVENLSGATASAVPNRPAEPREPFRGSGIRVEASKAGEKESELSAKPGGEESRGEQ
jgi:transcriptional repressor NrdR